MKSSLRPDGQSYKQSVQSEKTIVPVRSLLYSSKYPRKDDEDGFDEETVQLMIARAPDGGWGWVVVACSFMCNMIIDGMQFNFANLMDPIKHSFGASTAVVSLIGSILSGFYNFSGPIGSALANKFGFRMVVIVGSLSSAIGLSASFFAQDPYTLYFTYGMIAGTGFGMIYMASVITTSLYFDRYRAIATSISVCGTGVGMFVFAPLGNILVETFGWRYTLLFQAGFGLLCALFGLTFKPLDIITVVPTSDSESEVSAISVKTYRTIRTTDRESVFARSEGRRSVLPNIAFPTLKEALTLQNQDAQSRRPTHATISIARSQQVSTVFSMGQSLVLRPLLSISKEDEIWGSLEKEPKSKCFRCCQTCCFNFWHCRCRHRDLKIGDRPMYRDDVFYEQDLTNLPNYTVDDPVSFHLSVTRMAAERDVYQHVTQQCCVCHEAVLRPCVTMIGLDLMKNKTFIFLCISSFFYTLGIFIPYVFLREVTKETNIDEHIAVWLISLIGISNTVARIVSGLVKSFTNVNASMMIVFSLIVSGSSCFLIFISMKIEALYAFSCVFGFFTAPFVSLRPVVIVDFLGLNKLTNAFGLVLLNQGVASIIGPPLAGVVEDLSGTSKYPFALAGSFMLISAVSIAISILFHEREKRKEKRKEKKKSRK